MPKQYSILVVDDEQNMRVSLYEALARNGYHVRLAENGRMALELMQKQEPDLVVTDIRMPEMDGIEFLHTIRRRHGDLPVLIITGYATVATAVEAMKQGAVDYILKPFPVEVIEEAVQRALARAGEAKALPARRRSETRQRPLICQDDKMQRILEKARRVASSKATVLIMGESGTGKEVLARYIHENSNRKAGPFVALNCAALPEGLLESELFGHEKGAFTGAVTAKKGKFELADGGTLLLDEIGEVPLHLQAKLLRVLQESEVDRLGGRAPVTVDVHVLATTNRPLEQAVREGKFRQDLFYRLNVIPLVLPPLRERQADISQLAVHFVEKYCRLYDIPMKKISEAAMARFLAHDWPGNVRELENCIERAVLLSDALQLQPADFWDEHAPTAAGTAAGGLDVADAVEAGHTLKDVERQMILQALRKTDNNRTHAARMLGVSVRTLRNKLNEYRSQGILE